MTSGTTDVGVIKLRNIVRQGVRAVKRGLDPKAVIRQPLEVVPTYGHERLVSVPPAADRDADRQLLLEVGRKLAREVFDDPSSLHRLASERG